MSPAFVVAALGLGFLVTHLVLSHPPVRKRLVGGLGEVPFRGVYSAVQLGIFVLWVPTWWQSRHTAGRLWEMYGPLEVFAVLLGMIGFSLIAVGVSTPAPASLLAKHSDQGLVVPPIARITRHPVNVGIAHWAAAHLLVTPTVVDFGFYGPLLLTAVLGTLHQDWRKKSQSKDYREFAAVTTILPDPRGLAGLGERDWIAVGVGIFTAVILYSLHPFVFSP